MPKKILLGVTGSIAAYKSVEIADGLVRAGHEVRAVMTAGARKFITPLTLETITKNKVYLDLFEEDDPRLVTHIALAGESDLILIAPATYNLIGKLAAGIADDLLTSILAAAPSHKVVLAPAMNTNMYHQPVNLENMQKLTALGYTFIEPDEGRLACGAFAKGRLRNVPEILETIAGFFSEKLLKNQKVLISAGATREYLDPIRFISNTSSGLMGVSLAKACRDLGAAVTLVLANSPLEITGVNLIRVDTVDQMYTAVLREYEDSDLVFAAAAVSDFKPKTYSETKIKKTGGALSLELLPNTDILAELGKLKKQQYLVGFAAESADLFENARAKLEKKNLDLIIANNLANFSATNGKVWVISRSQTIELPKKSKEELAGEIVRTVLETKQRL